MKVTVELEIEGVDEADGDNELFLNKEIMIYEIVDAYLVPELMYNINFCHKVRKGDGFKFCLSHIVVIIITLGSDPPPPPKKW